MTLAIAAPSFNWPSETFIHDHVRVIAPGETVLLCDDGRGTERFDCPVLLNMNPSKPPTRFGESIVNRIEDRWRAYIDPAFV